MRFGVFTFLNDTGIGPVDLAVALESRGFGSLFVTEHTHIPVNTKTPYPMGGPIPPQYYRTLDPFVSLTAAAVATESLLLGTGISLVTQRDPIQTAKEVASLDLVSQGRFLFGVGVGWLREEIAHHGVDPKVRGRVMDERIRAMIEIWTKDEAEFHGEYVDFDPIYSWPKPLAKPHTPVYFGGGPANFPRIAEFDAGWLSLSPSADALAPDLAKLRDQAGADVPVIASHVGKVTTELLAGYGDLGIEHVTVELPTQPRDETLRRLDALHAAYAELG
ncbi:LLM class F420-dependent oxidoreductase [Candidatus Mycobacterium wuenschmannii]|uniref:LLM class F420-dependent oxidoreductase n=1 Tax=Candidatus Mycobacterium wuenschmannii TaxID=3027808 RepID=A0ABY8VZ43_9MYCO|nr:LLM class F420-dependent oxidoreductase [Candidatus Mycobacterium wuenschmannii]WIM86769.1 LLM class F420-dependent oxidoreductase [Candidatus Mycobacterium wuenschmannii]